MTDKFKVGDRVKRILDIGYFKSISGKSGDDILTISKILTNDYNNKMLKLEEIVNNNGNTGWTLKNFELVSESNQLNTQEDNMGKTKTVYKVLAVNKKTSEIDKDVTVVADNESQAILKAFGVDVENLEIKVTERTTFTEEKPQTVVLEKDKKGN